jgi:hypothetical protein
MRPMLQGLLLLVLGVRRQQRVHERERGRLLCRAGQGHICLPLVLWCRSARSRVRRACKLCQCKARTTCAEYPVMTMRPQIALCRRGWAHADHPARLCLPHSASWSHQVGSPRFLRDLIVEVFECVADIDGCPARPSDVDVFGRVSDATRWRLTAGSATGCRKSHAWTAAQYAAATLAP